MPSTYTVSRLSRCAIEPADTGVVRKPPRRNVAGLEVEELLHVVIDGGARSNPHIVGLSCVVKQSPSDTCMNMRVKCGSNDAMV
jgi:hypothetical protein